jgi:hypothetical protein
MGRPPGAQNKMTRERDAAAKELAEEYGDPLEDILQKREHWQEIYTAQMAKSSRHRNAKKVAEAEQMILRYNVEALPYMRPRYQAIAHVGDTAPKPMVIRAPMTISDSKAWLEAYGPKRDNGVNDKPPPVISFAKNLKTTLDIADAVGVNDAQSIIDEAAKITRNEHKS